MVPEQFGWLEAEFLRLADFGRLGTYFAILAVLAAIGTGAAHALAPGHGKAIIAAYLVGTQGRIRDAATLGAVVASMHSASVLVLGGTLYLTSRASASAASLMPLLRVTAGMLVLAVGAGLVHHQVRLRRARKRPPAGARARPQGHEHDHGAVLSHDHHHTPPFGVPPLSRRGVVLLGMSGGLLPSPSAFLSLTTALFVGRPGFGLALVLAFSAGLAATLTLVGAAAVRGRDLLHTRTSRHPRLARLLTTLPLASAIAVLGGGLLLTASALTQGQ